jgi:hypothetical protein
VHIVAKRFVTCIGNSTTHVSKNGRWTVHGYPHLKFVVAVNFSQLTSFESGSGTVSGRLDPDPVKNRKDPQH